MKNRILPLVLLMVLLSQLLPTSIFLNTVSAAGEITEIIAYEMKGDADDYLYGGLYFSDKPTLPTVPIVVPSKPGKIIKKMEWTDKDGKVLRSISIPAGKTEFKASDNLKDTLNGTRYTVRSKNNSNYGGIYYWDRWTAGDSGNFNGKYWRAGGGQVSVYTSEPGPNCPGGVPTENKNPNTGQSFNGNLPRYPGCTDPNLAANIPRTEAFYIVANGDSLHDLWIRDGGISKTDVKASRTIIDSTTPINDVHGTQGYTDPSTVAGQVIDVPNLNLITISFKQTFNNDTYSKYWANPGAKQVWYFSKFRADFDSYTYVYKDKKLKVTYADGTSGLEISGNTCVAPNGTTQLTATLTKIDGSVWPLQSHGKLTWSSSNTSTMTVNSSGLVTAVAPTGTATITAHFVDATQALDEKDTFEMTVGSGASCTDTGGGGNQPEIPEGNGSGQCSWTIGSPSPGTVMRQSDMDPGANGVIRADDRDSEKFDVLKGIPTSESLYTNALADEYLFKQDWGKMSGKTTYDCTVEVTYARQWTVPGPQVCTETGCTPGPPVTKTDTQSKTYTFQLFRDYSYWQINNLEVYKINQAEMSNYALPGGKVTMTPSGYTPPALDSSNDTDVNSHVRPANTSSITFSPPLLTGGLNSPPSLPDHTSTLKGMAESNTPQSKVNNDMVNFNGSTIMSSSETTKDGPIPSNIPNPTTINRDVLYKPSNMISNTLINKANTTSSGEIYYELLPGNVNGGINKVFPINGINTVTVHTPVVNYAWVSDDQPHNQKTVPNANRAALILERPFIVRIPTSGQHLDAASYPGYGNRDYAKYFRIKQVRFPFDVYNEGRSQFIPAKTWVDIPVNQLDTPFYLPVWVDEGDYEVEFRNIAENAPVNFTEQQDANTNLAHHVAADTVPVEVIGRLYDFRVTDISDYNWENVFRKQMGRPEPTGVGYWTGLNSIDGDPRGNIAPFILPIRPGSHPVQGFKNVAVKTGYHIKFDLKTKGNMFGKQDGVRITPSFHFVSRDGSSRQKVDLYYHRGQERLIRIGSAQDLEKRFVVLNARLRNVPSTELGDAARYQYTYELTTQEQSQITLAEYMVRFVDQTSHQKTWVGRYDWMILPASIRTLIGPKTDIPPGVNADRANAAIQRWYGEYSLPADVYAVQKGTDLEALARQHPLDEKSAIFQKDGYIVVNFNIESLRGGNTDAPHLQYIHAPLMNQWQMEGFNPSPANTQGRNWPLKDGDVVFYHADQSSRNDFQSQAPH
ncbi:DUF5704 domain-containing protein [Paenibacillus sp. NPDC057886]|uniref:DUF5704 domain-containing protein n=1 Tax=Paenibacillus sp. NPDC057886 TaxID=3346270 RepID=UPI0036D0A619